MEYIERVDYNKVITVKLVIQDGAMLIALSAI